MIIGDGDASRADRLNIFNADITSIGIYSGSHQDLGHQSCVLLSQDYTLDVNETELTRTNPQYRALDAEILAEINILRADPTSYITYLTDMLPRFNTSTNIYKEVGYVPI